jgi:hypothetical protein
MAIVIIVIALILLALGGYCGFRIGSHHIRQENLVLKTNISHLEKFCQVWAAEAAGSYNLSNQVSQMQTNNLTATMLMVIQLLNSYRSQNANGINTNENEKISDIINKAKSIASLHE